MKADVHFFTSTLRLSNTIIAEEIERNSKFWTHFLKHKRIRVQLRRQICLHSIAFSFLSIIFPLPVSQSRMFEVWIYFPPICKFLVLHLGLELKFWNMIWFSCRFLGLESIWIIHFYALLLIITLCPRCKYTLSRSSLFFYFFFELKCINFNFIISNFWLFVFFGACLKRLVDIQIFEIGSPKTITAPHGWPDAAE